MITHCRSSAPRRRRQRGEGSASRRKSRKVSSPVAAPSAPGAGGMMSAPIATCKRMAGMPRRRAAISSTAPVPARSCGRSSQRPAIPRVPVPRPGRPRWPRSSPRRSPPPCRRCRRRGRRATSSLCHRTPPARNREWRGAVIATWVSTALVEQMHQERPKAHLDHVPADHGDHSAPARGRGDVGA